MNLKSNFSGNIAKHFDQTLYLLKSGTKDCQKLLLHIVNIFVQFCTVSIHLFTRSFTDFFPRKHSEFSVGGTLFLFICIHSKKPYATTNANQLRSIESIGTFRIQYSLLSSEIVTLLHPHTPQAPSFSSFQLDFSRKSILSSASMNLINQQHVS